MFTSPGSIAFSFAGIDVRWYGIMMSLSIIAALIVIFLLKNKYFKDITTDSICDISFILIIFGIIFARIYYVILDYNYYIINPNEIPAVWNGGISIQGAIIGGIIGGYIYIKKNKLNFFRYADLFAFGLVTGQIIGRWGNFFNSEAFGMPSDLPLKLFIPYNYRPFEYRNFEYFHPAFLYESVMNCIILAVLLLMINRMGDKRQNGIIFLSYIIFYSVTRIIIESIRIDSVLDVFGIHIAQIVSVLFILIAALLIKKIKHQKSS